MARLQATRRAARAQEPSRLTPGEIGAIRYAWLSALVTYGAYNQGLDDLMIDLSVDLAAGTWPEPIARIAAAGLWPGDEGTEGVIEAVIAERMKRARLDALRGTARSTARPGGLRA